MFNDIVKQLTGQSTVDGTSLVSLDGLFAVAVYIGLGYLAGEVIFSTIGKSAGKLRKSVTKGKNSSRQKTLRGDPVSDVEDMARPEGFYSSEELRHSTESVLQPVQDPYTAGYAEEDESNFTQEDDQ
jgi:hypothetical protein